MPPRKRSPPGVKARRRSKVRATSRSVSPATSLAALLHRPRRANRAFERFAATALEELTGVPFVLARSGDQHGRDFRSVRPSAVRIAGEAKFYGRTVSLRERDLLGEIVEVVASLPDLDLWVLATTAPVSDQLEQKLRETLGKDGRSLFALSFQDGTASCPSSLELLMAGSQRVLLEELVPESNRTAVRQVLGRIRRRRGYSQGREFLRRSILDPVTGHGFWRQRTNEQFSRYFRDAAASVANLGSDVAVGAVRTNRARVKRVPIANALASWWRNWPGDHRPLVLVGGEGDGKSWCAADWLSERIDGLAFPAAFFLTSDLCSSQSLTELLADWSESRFRGSPPNSWLQRLDRWLRRNEPPTAVVVLDGINERKLPEWWRGFFDRMRASAIGDDLPIEDTAGQASGRVSSARTWFDQVAVMVTVRRVAWERYRDAWSVPNPVLIEVGPFSEEELIEALATHGISLNQLSPELRLLLSKPRFFDLGVRLRERIESSGDISPARLILEEWKDRVARKRQLTSFSDQDFQNLLRELAGRFKQGHMAPNWRELETLAPVPSAVFAAAAEELQTGGIFDEASGRLTLRPDYLYCGLGLVLADEVSAAVATGSPLSEVIAEHLGVEGLDQHASIVEAAFVATLAMPHYPRAARIALLVAMSELRNTSDPADDLLFRYLPSDPLLWAEFAESLLREDDRPERFDRLSRGFRDRWIQGGRTQDALRTALLRWLRLVCVQECAWAPRQEPAQLAARLASLEAAMGRRGEDRRLVPTDNPNAPALRTLALSIISIQGPRDWMTSLADSVLAEEVMGYPAHLDEIQWLLRCSKVSCQRELRWEVERLRGLEHPIATAAAARLLWAEGSGVADFEVAAFQAHEESIAEHRRDPCQSVYSWERDDWTRCCDRPDVAPVRRQREMVQFAHEPGLPVPAIALTELAAAAREADPRGIWTTDSHDWQFDDLEVCLAAGRPEELASLVRRVVTTLDERSGEDLRHVAFELPKRALALADEGRETVLRNADRLRSGEGVTDDLLFQDAMLFGAVLPWLPAGEQLLGLLLLPSRRGLRRFEASFRPPEDWALVADLLTSGLNSEALSRLLWYLSLNAESCPLSILELASRYWTHEESAVRAWALALARRAPPRAVRPILERWKPTENTSTFENRFGSSLLAEAGRGSLTFERIRQRSERAYWSRAVELRGRRRRELAAYAREVSRWLNSARDSIAHWSADNAVGVSDLRVLSGFNDNLLVQWASEFLAIDFDKAQHWHFCANGFFEALSRVLADNEPGLAIQLFDRLDRMRDGSTPTIDGIPLLDHHRFCLPDSSAARVHWGLRLQECKTDRDLFDLVRVAESGNAASWLDVTVAEGLASDVIWEKARALSLAAFRGCETTTFQLPEVAELRGWIGEHATRSVQLLRRWQWGQHWFDRFAFESDDRRAHAAWVLFLRCVDRRFSFWKDRPVSRLSFTRRAFLRNNNDDLQRHIKENEGKWDKRLFGEDIAKTVEPWLDA